jgi:hypothetical protein
LVYIFFQWTQRKYGIEFCYNFAATQPGEEGSVAVQKKKPVFKTASDGRLIITEDSSESEGDNAKDVDSGKFVTVDKMTTTHYSETSM